MADDKSAAVAGGEDVADAGGDVAAAGIDDVAADGGEDVVAGTSKRDEPDSDEDRVAGPSSKRIKLSDSESTEPSCVLSLRGLPNDVTEAEVAVLASQFGAAANIIMTRNKHKALLQMTDLDGAKEMVAHYDKNPLQVRSSEVAVNYSKHRELKLKVGETSVDMDLSRRVLHVIVDNMLFPVTLDHLVEVFAVYGSIAKILTFNLNDTFHALVQYLKGEAAQTAKLALNGQHVFNGCCKLFVEYSKLSDLVIKYNSDISRDYLAGGLAWNSNPSFDTATTHSRKADNKDPAADDPAATKKALLPFPQPKYLASADPSSVLPSQFLSPSSTVVKHVTNPYYVSQPPPPPAPASSALPDPKNVPWSERRPVVLVSNLDEGRVKVEDLFTLFGVYGDVIRVKVCCNTKSKALIQYKDYKYARDAIANLDGINLWGRQIKLAISKYRIVQMPKDGAHNADLTRDFTTSRWHRFHNGDRAEAPVVPPSKTLFLANIPPKVTDSKLKRLFNAFGTVVDFKFFEPSNLFRLQQAVQIAQLGPNSERSKDRILSATPDRRMALLEMRTVEEAIESLIKLHNKQFPGTNRYLCVSFTKSVIEHRDEAK